MSKARRATGVNGRQKGARGELQIARILSAWWTGRPELLKAPAKDLPFRRTPMSGGWAKGKALEGDLAVVDDRYRDFGHLSVEVKNSQQWSVEGLFKDKCAAFESYWKQCFKASRAAFTADPARPLLLPLLLFTRNGMPWYAALETRVFDVLFKGRSSLWCLRCHNGATILRLDALLASVNRARMSSYVRSYRYGDYSGNREASGHILGTRDV